MLRNKPIRSVRGDADRRWLSDDYFDLIVWYDTARQIDGFQLCYDKAGCERALTWKLKHGFSHAGIDGGESKPTVNRTPVLIADGPFPAEIVRREFLSRSRLLPAEIRDVVLAKITEYEEHVRA
jgi:hypothetical protein